MGLKGGEQKLEQETHQDTIDDHEPESGLECQSQGQDDELGLQGMQCDQLLVYHLDHGFDYLVEHPSPEQLAFPGMCFWEKCPDRFSTSWKVVCKGRLVKKTSTWSGMVLLIATVWLSWSY
jgi:hypothetical protein